MGAFAVAMPNANQQAVAIVAGQSALETANWSAMWNWNAGNLTTNGGTYVLQGKLSLHFQAFDSMQDGAAAMVAWLSTRGALPYALQGDLQGYVQALAKGCYLGCIGQVAQQSDGSSRAVTQGDYDTYRAGIQGRITQLGLLSIPLPAAGMSFGTALAAGAAIVAVGGAFAYTARREGWRLALAR